MSFPTKKETKKPKNPSIEREKVCRWSRKCDNAPMKLKAQFELVLNAFADARILRGTISAGYNHVMPSQPIAKKVLKRKRERAAAIPEGLVLSLVMIVSIICPSPGLDFC